MEYTDLHNRITHHITFARIQGWSTTVEGIAKQYGFEPEQVRQACVELAQSEPETYWFDGAEIKLQIHVP